jgi:hypothetical protein
MRYGLTTALLLLAPAWAAAQDVSPEQLLSAKAQIYLRWDGITAHKDLYAKTAVGKMLSGDMGTFLSKSYGQLQDGLAAVLTVERLLSGTPPEKLQQMQADAAEAAKLPALLGDKGFLLAGELTSLEPPAGQLTLIVPDAGPKAAPLFGAFRLLAGLSQAEVKELKIDGRTVSHFDGGFIHLFWWVEGKHAVAVLSSDKPEKVVKEMRSGNHARLDKAPLYQRLKKFDRYTTHIRAFVDVASLVQMGGSRDPKVKQLLDDLGLTSVKSAVLWSCFDGEAERDVVEIDVPGPRKGLLTLFAGKPFTLADVPPLPPDVVSWSMNQFDAAAFFELIFPTVEKLTDIIEPDALAEVKQLRQKLKDALGFDLHKDLLSALGDKVVLYATPSEGPLSLGQVVMIKVKDEAKVKAGLEALVKSIARAANGQVSLKKRTYHGVEVREVHVKEQGFFFLPTYAIHDGWLVLSFYPQPVHGFILRSTGALPAWKPSPRVKAALDSLPKETLGLSYNDPRPGLRQILALAPTVGALANSFIPESVFEVGSLPTAQEATHHLFPNVSAFSDDGKVLRMESRMSLSLPFELAGVDSYAIALFLAFAARF